MRCLLAGLILVAYSWAQSSASGVGPAAILFSQTASVTVTGTIAETTLTGAGTGSLTIPGNYFVKAGDVLHIYYQGIMTPGSSATLYTVKIKFGSTTIVTGSATPSASAQTYGCMMDLRITAITVGTTGTVLATGYGMQCVAANDSTFDGTAFTSTTPVTVNTTIAQTIDMTITPGAVAQSFTSTNLFLSRN